MAGKFPTLGIAIEGTMVRKCSVFGAKGAYLGQLAGAQAEISDATRHRRVGASVVATSVLGPVPCSASRRRRTRPSPSSCSRTARFITGTWTEPGDPERHTGGRAVQRPGRAAS